MPSASPSSTGTDATEPTTPAPSSSDDTTSSAPQPSTSSGEDSDDTPTQPTPTSPGSILLQEDFEAHPAGARPEGYDVFCNYVLNPDSCNSGHEVAVSSENARGGSQSILFEGSSGAAQLAWNIPPGTTRLYTRVWVFLSQRKLGNNSDGNHETLIALRGSPEGVTNEIRFGEIKGVIGTNVEPTDNISPPADQWNSGPEIPVQEWACVELAFLGESPTNELHAWVNGELVHSIDSLDDWTHAFPESDHEYWTSGWIADRFNQLVFGWQSFSGFTEKLFMDDIVVATDPIGCD